MLIGDSFNDDERKLPIILKEAVQYKLDPRQQQRRHRGLLCRIPEEVGLGKLRRDTAKRSNRAYFSGN